MANTTEDFYKESRAIVESFNLFAKKHALAGVARADHICYKCDSKETFERLREMFEPAVPYLYQAIIAKRRIAIIKLPKEIVTDLGPISFLELSDQKPDGSQKGGFDHIEIYPHTYGVGVGVYDKLAAKLEREGEAVIKVARPHHTTHDIKIEGGFLVRLTTEPLIEKIKREEMI